MAPKILVVEDNVDNRELLVKVLARHGYEVLQASSGEEALAIASDARPDLVLMDLGLGGIDGLEATRRLKTLPGLSGVPVVAITAYAMVGDRERALDAGCDGYIPKPVDVRALPGQVEGYLRGSKEG